VAAQYPPIVPTASAALKDAQVTPADWLQVVEELFAALATLGANPHISSVDGTVYADVGARIQAAQSALILNSRVGRRALRIVNNNAAPNSKLDITADLLGIEGTIVQAVSGSVDITVNGLNGFDNLGADPEDANFWYYVWVGVNAAGNIGFLLSKQNTRAGLVLTHATVTGYTKWVRVGAVRNNASSNFLQFIQEDDHVYYRMDGTDANSSYSVNVTNTVSTVQNVDVKKYIPPTSRIATIFVVPIANANAGQQCNVLNGTAGTGTWGMIHTNSPILVSYVIDIEVDSTQIFRAQWNGTGGGNTVALYARGYVDPI
jgi:hypothetical protein